MKIVFICRRVVGDGFLSRNAMTYLKSQGFEFDTEKEEGVFRNNEEWTSISSIGIKRTDHRLVEAIERYGYEMPHFEVIDVPDGNYKILTSYSGQDDTLIEVVVEEGHYWQHCLSEEDA